MAEEFKISLQAEVNQGSLEKIKSDLDVIKKPVSIKITLNDGNTLSTLSKIKKELEGIKGMKVDIGKGINVASMSTEISKKITDVAAKSKAVIKLQTQLDDGFLNDQVESLKNKINSTFGSLQKAPDQLRINVDDLVDEFKKLNSASELDNNSLLSYERFKQLLSDTEKQLNSYISEQNNSAKAAERIAKAENEANKARARSEILSNKITAWMNSNSKAAEHYRIELERIQTVLKGNSSPQEYTKALIDFQKVQAQAKASGLITNQFAQSLKNATLQMVGLGSTVMALSKVRQLLRNMYNEVVQIDTAMTNLKKVTDETATRYEKFLTSSGQSAKELGRSMSSLIEQTATWAKLGYGIDQAESLAKISSVYANVGEVGDETAVSDMVTAMKAFNIEAERAISVVDPLNELGNNFATSAADLGAGLAKSASSLSLAGADIYETLAMITGVAEITQNASEAGNSLKIASMRIRGMKGQLEELGEEVDETVDSISKVQTQVLNLTHGKVNIFDGNGEFRNYYEIMKEIAAIFDDLRSTEQASLSEILFGKVRGNQGAALIRAFQSGQVEKALETARNSDGSAMKEQEKWMESLEAKTNQLKAVFQSLSNDALNSNFLKGGLDAIIAFVSGLDKLIQKLGLFETLVASGGIAALIKNFGL